jgi:transposase
MLTAMTEEDWTRVLQVFAASCSRLGAKGRNDRRFLEALHFFAVHTTTWQALPEYFGNWNSIWNRLCRLSPAGVFKPGGGEQTCSPGTAVRLHHRAGPCSGLRRHD